MCFSNTAHHVESIVGPVVVDRRKCDRPTPAAFRSLRATRLLAAEQAACERTPDQQANSFAFQQRDYFPFQIASRD